MARFTLRQLSYVQIHGRCQDAKWCGQSLCLATKCPTTTNCERRYSNQCNHLVWRLLSYRMVVSVFDYCFLILYFLTWISISRWFTENTYKTIVYLLCSNYYYVKKSTKYQKTYNGACKVRAPPQNYALQYFVDYYSYLLYSAFDYPSGGQKIYDERMKYLLLFIKFCSRLVSCHYHLTELLCIGTKLM